MPKLLFLLVILLFFYSSWVNGSLHHNYSCPPGNKDFRRRHLVENDRIILFSNTVKSYFSFTSFYAKLHNYNRINYELCLFILTNKYHQKMHLRRVNNFHLKDVLKAALDVLLSDQQIRTGARVSQEQVQGKAVPRGGVLGSGPPPEIRQTLTHQERRRKTVIKCNPC